MNQVIITGNLGQDVTVRNTQTGKQVANFTLAVRRRGSNQQNPVVDWVRVSAWDKTAEFASKYLRKGSRVLVEGRLQVDNYEKDGVKQSAVTVVANTIEFAGGKPADGSAAPAQAPAAAPQGDVVSDDDIPF